MITTEQSKMLKLSTTYIIFEPQSDHLDEHFDDENPGENIVVKLQLIRINYLLKSGTYLSQAKRTVLITMHDA